MASEPLVEAALDSAEYVIGNVRSQRMDRSSVLRAAREGRARARRLRRQAQASRDQALTHRWRLWSAGLVAEPPTFVPESWRVALDVETLLDDAALACLECRNEAEAFRELHVVAALCDVAANQILGRGPSLAFLLSATARLIDQREPSFDTGDAQAVVCASAMRRCRELCRTALIAMRA